MSAATPTPRRETVYVSVAETAKLVRAALKAAFPGVTFSVRSKSYSMGASISVRWTDGPTEKDVERITGEYRGATFDGMIDLKSYVTREVNGQKVHYGADYIHTIRSYSVPFAQAIADQVADQWGQSWPTIRASSYDGSAVVSTDGEPITTGHGYRGYVTLGDLINEKLGETDARTVELITA